VFFPLVLFILSLLQQSVSYPLLPHLTVHKPLANLFSVAVRYDAIHMYTDAAHTEQEVFNKAEYAHYRRRDVVDNTTVVHTYSVVDTVM
jgi:hypothetical protein